MEIINMENFFNFENHEPVNRISYTKEDAKYKLKCMKSMQDLGMKISIDNVGNICGSLPGNLCKNKNLVLGSHTDSVTNGGQFDGPVGVYMALKAVEDFKNSSSKKQYGNIKTVIYACEESTRFKTACLGSYYLSGELPYSQIANLTDKNGISFNEAIAEYKDYIFSHLSDYGIDLNNISMVDKILTEPEISEAIESHIEQAEILSDSNISIGGIDSIGKPLRGTISINGKNAILTSAKIICDLNELSLSSKTSDKEETLRITVPKFNSLIHSSNKLIHSENSNLIKINCTGESNHSGATPMDKRKDTVLGISKLIVKLDNLQKENPNLHFEFLGSDTEKWGPNQIQDNANLVLKLEPPTALGIVNTFAEDIQEENNVLFHASSLEIAQVQENPFSELFVDVRQQYPATAEDTHEKIYQMFKKIQEKNNNGTDTINFRISSKNTPVQTSPELLENIKNICDEKRYPCQIMHSWPGHDLACVLPPTNKSGKRILFFIPSKGGSHNPNETTSSEAIKIGTDVYTTLVSQRMHKFQEQFEKKYGDELTL